MTDAGSPELDAVAIFEVLERHQVQYVVVGGYAAELHGSTRRTVDVDVVPDTTHANLTRLADALRELSARVRTDTEPAGLPFHTSAEALAGVQTMNLITAHGELDLTFTPSGTAGYPDLQRGAVHFPIGHVQVRVAALADVIRSKAAAGRRKDLDALPELRRLATTQQTPPANKERRSARAARTAGQAATARAQRQTDPRQQ